MKIHPDPVAGDVPAADVAVEALRALINDIDQFISSWMCQFDHEMLALQCSQSADHAVRKRLQEYEMEKRRFEAAQKREAHLARQRAEHLTAAWLHLEAEQRRFLQLKQAHGGEPLEATPQVDPATQTVTAGSHRERSLQFEGDAAPIGPSQAGTAASDVSDRRSREAAVLQFRRLRQEIRALEPRSGRP